MAVEQITREALASMSPADIVEAQKEGRLDDVLAGLDPVESQRRQFLAEADEARAELARRPATTPGQGANAHSAHPDIATARTWLDAERAKLRQMTPAEIVAAHDRGDFDHILNIKEQAE